MNILYFTYTDPKMTEYGGQQRAHVIWKGLQTVGDVWVVCPVPNKGSERQDIKNRIYHLCLERRFSVGWFFGRFLHRIFPQLGLSFGTTLLPIKKLDVKFDVVVARTLHVVGRYRPWRIAPMYVDVDDTPLDDFSLAFPKAKLKQMLLRLWQNKCCAHATLLWVPDFRQTDAFCGFNVACLPNIPLVLQQKILRERCDECLVFVGYLAHYPNQVALEWFLSMFWNDIKKKIPNIKLQIIGGGLPDDLKKKWSIYKDVSMLGFVKELSNVYAAALALIAPMQIGSGTCIKVLEALSFGVPVLATNQGLRGIKIEDRKEINGIYQFDDCAMLVEKILQIITYAGHYEGALDYIKRYYSQEAINTILQNGLAKQ